MGIGKLPVSMYDLSERSGGERYQMNKFKQFLLEKFFKETINTITNNANKEADRYHLTLYEQLNTDLERVYKAEHEGKRLELENRFNAQAMNLDAKFQRRVKELEQKEEQLQREHEAAIAAIPLYNVYSREHVEGLRRVFRQRQYNSETKLTDVAHSAGQQEVIDYIERQIKQ